MFSIIKKSSSPHFSRNQINKTKFSVLLTALFVISACGGGGGSSSNSSDGPASLNLTANPLSVAEGESTQITWQALNSVSCRAEGTWTSETTPAGQITVGPLNRTTSFTMSCLGKEGGPITESVTVVVDSSPPSPSPSITLTASPSNINANESSTIRWTTSNADSCAAVGGWSNSTSANGSQLIASIPNTNTYSLRCTGPGGSVTESVNVVVNNVPPPPAPSLNLSADDLMIEANESTTIRWNTNNADTCTADGGWSASTNPNSQQLISSIPSTTTYSMTCIGAGGSVTESITITVIQTTLGTVELSWDTPTTNEDGSALTDLDSYTIYYGTNQNNLNQIININNAGITTYVFNNLPAATYYFSVTANDGSNNESARSNIASKVIR